MPVSYQVILVLAILCVGLFLLWRRAVWALKDTNFRKVSLSTRYGKMTEQFMPFLKNYPHNPENFRFLGTPIDGIQFEDDKIVFIEFKAASSQLSPRQKQIAELILNKRIEFREHRID